MGFEYVEEIKYFRIWHMKKELETNIKDKIIISRILRKVFTRKKIQIFL